MRLVKQYNDLDCGLSTAAMVCDKEWQDVADIDPNPDSDDGFTTREFLMVCSRLGRRVGMIKASGKKYLCNAEPPQKCCAMLIRRHGSTGNTPDFGHYVAFDGERVFDPDCKRPVPWRTYKKRRWKICRWFVYC